MKAHLYIKGMPPQSYEGKQLFLKQEAELYKFIETDENLVEIKTLITFPLNKLKAVVWK